MEDPRCPSVLTFVFGAQNNCHIETLLLSTHNIYAYIGKYENHFLIAHLYLKV